MARQATKVSEGRYPVMVCSHPQSERIGFFPSTTAGHERCMHCDGVRYQRGDGTWWGWQYPTERDVDETGDKGATE
jgi:hypothetical protein